MLLFNCDLLRAKLRSGYRFIILIQCNLKVNVKNNNNMLESGFLSLYIKLIIVNVYYLYIGNFYHYKFKLCSSLSYD